MVEEKNIYQSPLIEIIEVQVEKGFATSLDYKQTPSMPFGDDTPQWF